MEVVYCYKRWKQRACAHASTSMTALLNKSQPQYLWTVFSIVTARTDDKTINSFNLWQMNKHSWDGIHLLLSCPQLRWDTHIAILHTVEMGYTYCYLAHSWDGIHILLYFPHLRWDKHIAILHTVEMGYTYCYLAQSKDGIHVLLSCTK